MSDETVTLFLTHDQALVLAEFFGRFHDTDHLAFAHPSEFIAAPPTLIEETDASRI